jgi:putative addiction module component (TIGR02574 family)
MSRKEILSAALTLPERERVYLVEDLLESITPAADELDEEAFLAEVARRSDEVEKGTAELVPWSVLRDEPF